MKRFAWVLLLLLCSACEDNTTTSSNLIDFIPRKATVIIKTKALDKLLLETKNNQLLTSFKDTHYATALRRQGKFLSHFDSGQESLITFTKIGKDDYDISYITKNTPLLFKKDSSKYTQKTITATNPKIVEITTEDLTFYTVIISETFIASSSQLLLENTIREQHEIYTRDPSFNKAYNTSSASAVASVLMKGEAAGEFWQTLVPKIKNNPFNQAFSWLQADLDLSKDDLKANGVILVKDAAKLHLQLFKDTRPQPNRAAQITPLSATAVHSISYDNWGIYKANLAAYHGIDPATYTIAGEKLLTSFNEVSSITTVEGAVICATTLDPETVNSVLSSERAVSSTFRQVPIYKLENVNFKHVFAKAYSEILPLPEVHFYCVIEDFYLFAPSINSLENTIANYQNKATLAASEAYKNTASQLSRSSSILHIYNTSKIPYPSLVSDKEAKKLTAISMEAYPFVAVQLIQDSGFMHLQSVINKNESPLQEGAVTQIASTKLDETIILAPKLVKNHRTKGMDIVLQDQAYNLYLLSNSGKILWKKSLDGPIVGDIQQVDLYRNGRLQLAFVTQNTFYILDRNGNEVAPFPLNFKDAITQPLAIFDYEKNRNYRFVITQTDGVMMYDKTAKQVKGFSFSKASHEIILPPQHIRIDGKDYITIAQKNGKLNILSRTGNPRIAVAEKINFSKAPLQNIKNAFVTYDVHGERIHINTKGTLTKMATDYGSGSVISFNDKHSVAIRGNVMYINNNKKNMEYGTYTAPLLSTIKRDTYIATTDIESNQTYVFNKNGKLLDNFPVYGTSRPFLGLLERNKTLGFVTQGDDKTVLVYRIN